MARDIKGCALVELDGKLASAFKLVGKRDETNREKAVKQFETVRMGISEDGFRRSLEGIFEDFCRPPALSAKLDSNGVLEHIRRLLDRGFVETAVVLFIGWCETLRGLQLERVLSTVPSLACLEAWRKLTKAPTQEMEKLLLADPVATYATAGADWLLVRAKPTRLFPLIELFLARRERPAFLHPWNEALTAAMKRDKRGLLLGAVLRHPWPTPDSMAALAEVVRKDRSLVRLTVDLLPMILAQRHAVPTLVRFIEDIFQMMIATEGTEREFKTGALARLGTGIILAERRGQESEAALAVVASAARQLRNLTRDEVLQARTWVLDNLRQVAEPTDARLHVTIEGARHLALAFEKAAQGFAANDILAVTARNLGLTRIGNIGDVVAFNPLRHEDVEGGLVPGDSVHIKEAGWSTGSEALIRAKVKRTQGNGDV